MTEVNVGWAILDHDDVSIWAVYQNADKALSLMIELMKTKILGSDPELVFISHQCIPVENQYGTPVTGLYTVSMVFEDPREKQWTWTSQDLELTLEQVSIYL